MSISDSEKVPSLYITDIGNNKIVMIGEDAIVYADSPSDIDIRSVGGAWGNLKHTIVKKNFNDSPELYIFIQKMIDAETPFLRNDRLYQDAVSKVVDLRGGGAVSGNIKAMELRVNKNISVRYDMV